MNGTPGTAATELGLLLENIASSMRQPETITRACPGDYADVCDFTFALANELRSVKVARALTTNLLRSWVLSEMSNDVTTVISELVTNALRYGAPENIRDWVVLLRLIRNLDTVIGVVADRSSLRPVLKEPDYVAETGRGLHVVQACSRKWGWAPCRLAQGKIVWAIFR